MNQIIGDRSSAVVSSDDIKLEKDEFDFAEGPPKLPSPYLPTVPGKEEYLRLLAKYEPEKIASDPDGSKAGGLYSDYRSEIESRREDAIGQFQRCLEFARCEFMLSALWADLEYVRILRVLQGDVNELAHIAELQDAFVLLRDGRLTPEHYFDTGSKDFDPVDYLLTECLYGTSLALRCYLEDSKMRSSALTPELAFEVRFERSKLVDVIKGIVAAEMSTEEISALIIDQNLSRDWRAFEPKLKLPPASP